MPNKVRLGSTIKVKDLIVETEHDYKIVAEPMKNIKRREFSCNSYFGKAMLGSKKGEIITVKSPAGAVDYQIIDII